MQTQKRQAIIREVVRPMLEVLCDETGAAVASLSRETEEKQSALEEKHSALELELEKTKERIQVLEPLNDKTFQLQAELEHLKGRMEQLEYVRIPDFADLRRIDTTARHCPGCTCNDSNCSGDSTCTTSSRHNSDDSSKHTDDNTLDFKPYSERVVKRRHKPRQKIQQAHKVQRTKHFSCISEQSSNDSFVSVELV
jgi:hypothetical protein